MKMMERSHVAKEVNIPKQNVPFNSKDLKYIHKGTAQSSSMRIR